MLKQAWRSYIASFHPRYLKKAYDTGVIFQLIYWFVIYPTIMNIINEENVELYDLMARMFVRLIPYMIMGYSNISSKFLMTKSMYLSPMKEQDREAYINNVLLIKIGVSVFLGVCIELIWGAFTKLNVGKLIIMIIANFSIGIASYISLQALGKMNRRIREIVMEKTLNTKNHWTNTLVIISAIMVMVSIGILEIGAEESLAIFCNWFIVIVTLVLLALDILIVCTEYKATIALVGDYELAFKVQGKVEPVEVKFDLFAKKE